MTIPEAQGTLSYMNLDNMAPTELAELRAQIEALLDIQQLDLNQELVSQFRLTSQLIRDAQDDEDIPANKLSSLLTAGTALLRQISETQQKLFSASRLQIMERCLAEALQTLPKKTQEDFIERYSKALEEAPG